ncbi:MAG TPA: hypothetical protein VNO30_46575 [Kofleriaceae bacterium]|nr:hypothetical protein [Kofleriaceae bacterium]
MSSEQIIIGVAEARDRDGLAELLDQAYGPHNPYWAELDGWLRGDGALTIVAAQVAPGGVGDEPPARIIVGMARLCSLAPDEWWFESLITREGFRRRGVMQRIFVFGYTWWLEHGAGTVRGMTSNYNTAAHEQSEKWNATRTQTYTHYVAPPAAEPAAHHFAPLGELDVDGALAAVAGSPILAASGGLVEQRWRWRGWSRDYATAMARAGELFGWRGGRGVVAMWTRRGPDGPELRVWLAAGDDLAGLARDIRAYAAAVLSSLDPRPGRIHWRIPEAAGLDGLLQEAGFAIRDGFEHRFHIYEFTRLGEGGIPTSRGAGAA